MRKSILIFLIIIVTISCEKDDFCSVDAVTPKLIIKFMNHSKTDELKRIDSLCVWAEKKDSLFRKATKDSISIPLNPLKNETTYNLSVSPDSISTIRINYTKKEEFISRSCGFRILFENIKVSEIPQKKSWIKNIPIKEISSIKNQKNAHITLYH